MKNILILGVSGFLGKYFYDNLSKENNVYGISRTEVRSKNCFSVDLLSKEDLSTFVKDKNFDVVINLAATLAKSNNLTDINVLINNITVSHNIVEALKGKSKFHLINFSSSSIYSNNSENCDEKSLIDPSENTDCLYGLSKFNSEMLFNFLLKDNSNITNLRIPMVYGEGMESSRIHMVFMKELEEMNTITLFGEGERIISHISIEELFIKVKNIISKKVYGTYNVSGESVSTQAIAKKIIREFGNDQTKIIFEKKGSRNKFIFNGSKLDDILGQTSSNKN